MARGLTRWPQDVLLHASIDCGLSAAVDAFHTAAEVVDVPRAV
ncbi:hypothetical protein [Polaromonas sp. A23]